MPLTAYSPPGEDGQPRTSREWVRFFVAQALSRGEPPPSQLAVRQAIEQKTGLRVSPNLVADEIGKFWAARGPELEERLALPNISTEAQEAFESLWRVALRDARAQFAEQAAQATAAVTDAQATLAAQEQALAQRNSQVEVLTLQLSQLDGQLATYAQTTGQLQQTVEQLTARNQALEGDLSRQQQHWEGLLRELQGSHQAVLASQVQGHADELARLTADRAREAEQWEGLRRHLLRETDRIRVELQGRVAALEQALAREKEARQTLRDELFAQQQAYARLQGTLEGERTARAALPAIVDKTPPEPS